MASLFETETCSRCGGTGRYSYNQISGSTCFKCNGAKVTLTKRGAAASAWYRKQQMTPVEQLKIGDRVYESDMVYRGWWRVTDIEKSPIRGYNISLQLRLKDGRVRNSGLGQWTGEVRTRPVDVWGVRWQQMVALAYQATLTKAGKPATRSK